MNFLLIQRLQNGILHWDSVVHLPKRLLTTDPGRLSCLFPSVRWEFFYAFLLDEWFAFCWSYPPRFYFHNYISCWVQTVKPLIMHFLQYHTNSSLSPNIIFRPMFLKILSVFSYLNLGAELSHWCKNQLNLCFCLFLIFRFLNSTWKDSRFWTKI